MNTHESIAAYIGGALEPLTLALSDPLQARGLLNALGWELPPGIQDIGLTRLDVSELIEKVTNLHAAFHFEAGNSGASAGLSADLLITVQDFLRSLNTFAKGLGSIASGDYLTRTRIREEFAGRLLDLLLIRELTLGASYVSTFLTLCGIIRYESHPADPVNFQTAHVRSIIAYDRIGTVLTDTRKQLVQFFEWGTPQFDAGKVLTFFGFFLQSFGGRGTMKALGRGIEERLSGHSVPQAETDPVSQLIVSFTRAIDLGGIDVGVTMLELRPTTPAGLNGGFAFSPFVKGTPKMPFPIREGFTLSVDSSYDLAQGCVVSFRPGQPVQIQTQVIGNGAVETKSNGRIAVRTQYERSNGKPIQLLVLPGGARLDFTRLTTSFGVDTGASGVTPVIEFGLKGLRFHLEGLGSDGFLAKILPSSFDADFDLTIGWSGEGGVYFQGNSMLEIKLASHISLGAVDLNALKLSVGVDKGKFPVTIAADLQAALGPLVVQVGDIGIAAAFSFVGGSGGNLGPLQLDMGFKPPTRIGLSLDAAIVKGGGYLDFDPNRGEYGGVFELSLAAIATVKAIGLITTRMPDGSKGFSLLIILSAEFAIGIQLGFGFTLLGVGGLLGLNRTMLLEPLASGIRTGAVNSIMFPPDPVANAPRIISDLRTYFPPYEGRFLIGPMLKLGWGTPTLISLSFSLIIEIPGNITIVGLLHVALPAEIAPLIVINVAFLGAVEFDKRRTWFFASMYDSRILYMTLEGEMGLLMDYSDNPNFVLSVGGFHPAFNPPPLPFPNPRRIHVDVLRNPLQRITIENYFAITSNTVQIGARAELFYGIDAFNIHGSFGFDALFQFSPFHFIIEISFSVSMDLFGTGVFSLNLRFRLQGPGPFRARGEATLSIDLWMFSIDVPVDFDISWGEADNPVLPPVQAIPLLVGEFNKLDNWQASLPRNANLLVSLRKLDAIPGTLVLHPLGTLRVSQRAVPLGIHIDKIGNNPVSDAHLLAVQPVSGLGKTAYIPTEKFAIAQYQNLTDADKLSRRAYEDMPGGVELSFAGRQIGSSKVVKRIVRYEVKIIDNNFKYFVVKWFTMVSTLFDHWLGGSAAARSPLSSASKKAMVPTNVDERVRMGQPEYVVAGVADNKPVSAAAIFSSEAKARDFLQAEIATKPGMAGEIHVIPKFESIAS